MDFLLDLAIAEDDEGGKGGDLVGSGDVLLVVGVDLDKLDDFILREGL